MLPSKTPVSLALACGVISLSLYSLQSKAVEYSTYDACHAVLAQNLPSTAIPYMVVDTATYESGRLRPEVIASYVSCVNQNSGNWELYQATFNGYQNTSPVFGKVGDVNSKPFVSGSGSSTILRLPWQNVGYGVYYVDCYFEVPYSGSYITAMGDLGIDINTFPQTFTDSSKYITGSDFDVVLLYMGVEHGEIEPPTEPETVETAAPPFALPDSWLGDVPTPTEGQEVLDNLSSQISGIQSGFDESTVSIGLTEGLEHVDTGLRFWMALFTDFVADFRLEWLFILSISIGLVAFLLWHI